MTKPYSEKLRDPRWQKKRLEVMQRDKFTCKWCGDKETELHVHHKKYTGEPWEAPKKDLETVCKWCHHILSIQSKTPFTENLLRICKNNSGFTVYSLKDNTKAITLFLFRNGGLDNVVSIAEPFFIQAMQEFKKING